MRCGHTRRTEPTPDGGRWAAFSEDAAHRPVAHHHSKPGGHPGHDRSRRLSIPPVVAPEVLECCSASHDDRHEAAVVVPANPGRALRSATSRPADPRGGCKTRPDRPFPNHQPFSNHHPFPNHWSGRNAPGSAECSSRPIRQPMIGEASVKPPRCRRRALHAVTITHRLHRAGRTARRLSSSRQPVRHPHGASFCEARDGCQGLASSRRCAVPRRARETACNHPIPGAKNFLPAVQALSK